MMNYEVLGVHVAYFYILHSLFNIRYSKNFFILGISGLTSKISPSVFHTHIAIYFSQQPFFAFFDHFELEI
jgi:hypothetical protein